MRQLRCWVSQSEIFETVQVQKTAVFGMSEGVVDQRILGGAFQNVDCVRSESVHMNVALSNC